MSMGIKLAVGGLIVAAVTGYMAWLGAASSWQYYLTVDECVDGQSHLAGARLRVHGTITADSLRVAEDRTRAWFELHGERGALQVVCDGPLPDNLQDKMEVVVEGQLDGVRRLAGDRVMTQCASKYESDTPESHKQRDVQQAAVEGATAR